MITSARTTTSATTGTRAMNVTAITMRAVRAASALREAVIPRAVPTPREAVDASPATPASARSAGVIPVRRASATSGPRRASDVTLTLASALA